MDAQGAIARRCAPVDVNVLPSCQEQRCDRGADGVSWNDRC
jgi:hypothetical protein